MKLLYALFASALVIPSIVSSCGGYDCVEQSCASLVDGASADTNVSICQHPQGDCGDGCTGWRVLDTNGNKISDCLDSEPGNCEPFMKTDAKNYCALGHVVECAG